MTIASSTISVATMWLHTLPDCLKGHNLASTPARKSTPQPIALPPMICGLHCWRTIPDF
jgi:hypothetical protein